MNAIEDKIENLKNIIKRNGDRITKPRLAVYEFLVSNQGHFSAQQIYNAIRETIPDITLATVYNVLRYLADIGVIQEIPTPTETLYDGTEVPHAHLICMECGKVQDVVAVNIIHLSRLPKFTIGNYSKTPCPYSAFAQNVRNGLTEAYSDRIC